MTRLSAGPVVVGLLVAVGVVLVATVLLDLRLTSAALRAARADPGTSSAVVGAVLVGCGVLVRRRLRPPPARVGAVLVGLGLLWAVDGLLSSWSALGAAQPVPWSGAAFGLWFVDRVGAFLLVGLPLLLTLYPTGTWLRGRWRFACVAAVVAGSLLPLLLLVVPLEIAQAEQGRTIPVAPWDPIRVPLPAGFVLPALGVCRVLAFVAPLGGLLVVLVRYRRGTGAERRSLRWLLWAGVMAVIVVVLTLLFPSSVASIAGLYTVVVVTAVSVTIGVVAPDRFDVDTLVATTVGYAAVAAVVVALDLGLVALGTAVLGNRLSERNVALGVLLVTVVVYVPLRAWISRGVSRLLVGRRGDRYQVVSALAARLEATPLLADQLPALAEAVADAFKVGFVEVEVLRASGASLVATYGSRPDATVEHPITYRGERVGRLVVTERGLRGLLSARDRRLLLDVVRQAAVAVRADTLARDLQVSREQLVLAREEDRRRIRRDLHDGLGPVLSGVALQLDAAGYAVATDPDRAAGLVRQSRRDIGDALVDVRRLVHGLRPPALDDLGLLAAVEQHADGLRAAGIAVRVEADDLGRLPAAVEVAAYRIVAEALTNVARHAGARSVEVTLRRRPDALSVSVGDDGGGIGTEIRAGVGLLSMRERADELGGRVRVGERVGGGSLVDVTLPLAAADVRA